MPGIIAEQFGRANGVVWNVQIWQHPDAQNFCYSFKVGGCPINGMHGCYSKENTAIAHAVEAAISMTATVAAMQPKASKPKRQVSHKSFTPNQKLTIRPLQIDPITGDRD